MRCGQQATAALPCGHSATWTCGLDVDPRTNPDQACAACALPLWRRALGEDADSSGKQIDEAALVRDLRCHALRAVPASAAVVKRLDFQVVVAALADARRVIVRAYHDALRETLDKNTGGVEVCNPPPLTDLSHYDVVFKALESRVVHDPANNSALQGSVFSSTPTMYGEGVELKLLTLANLAECPAAADGLLYICIGVAFRHRALENVPPFKQAGSDGKTVRRDANNAAARYRTAGLDYVVTSTLTPMNECRGVQANNARIYWINGAALPLSILTLELHRQCMICMDHFGTDGGCNCCTNMSHQHFTCWGCLLDLARCAQAPDATRRTVDAEGNLLCPHPGCSMVYRLHHVAMQAGEEVLRAFPITDELVKLQTAAKLSKELPQALMMERKRLTAQFDRIQSIEDQDERTAENVRLEIVENILTLRCPNTACRAVFYDFDGCFAILCSNCHRQFCGWCMQGSEHGKDVHGHVASCPEGSGLHESFETFQSHQRKRQGRLIRARLAKELPDVREHAKRKLRCDLVDDAGNLIDID